jgi:intracellular sulfur oxidation DsrE/DsrF family protein
MRKPFFITSFLLLSFFSIAQVSPIDSVAEKQKKDSIRMEKIFATATYPLIKNSKWSGVIPVNDIQENIDPFMQYKLLMEVVLWSRDSAAKKEINGGLAEVGRLINLHIAAGVPIENIQVAIIIHGPALNVLLSNEAYQKKFKTNNPNLDILKQFSALGVKMMACGQAMAYFNYDRKDMIPEVKTTLSAKVILSSYQLKGYVLYKIEDEK